MKKFFKIDSGLDNLYNYFKKWKIDNSVDSMVSYYFYCDGIWEFMSQNHLNSRRHIFFAKTNYGELVAFDIHTILDKLYLMNNDLFNEHLQLEEEEIDYFERNWNIEKYNPRILFWKDYYSTTETHSDVLYWHNLFLDHNIIEEVFDSSVGRKLNYITKEWHDILIPHRIKYFMGVVNIEETKYPKYAIVKYNSEEFLQDRYDIVTDNFKEKLSLDEYSIEQFKNYQHWRENQLLIENFDELDREKEVYTDNYENAFIYANTLKNKYEFVALLRNENKKYYISDAYYNGEEYEGNEEIIISVNNIHQKVNMHEPIRLTANDFEKGGLIKLEDIFDNKFYSYGGQFLYPPRIENKIPPKTIKKFDNGNFIAQPKLNGSNTSVTISKNSAVAKERHNKFFAVPPKFDFQSLYRGNGYMCITGEFMNKSKKDQNGIAFKGFCIWDIVAYDGKLLLGSTIEQRMELLEKLYPAKGEVTHNGITYLLKTDTPDVYRVNNFYGKFEKLYDTLSKIDMVEGLVLKRKNGELENLTREQNNVGWAIKVRKATKNYRY